MVHDSFTYIAGTETATASNSYTVPDSIQYYVYGKGWGTYWAYSTAQATREADPFNNSSNDGPARIAGFRWYWRNIPSATKWDDSLNGGLGGNTANAAAKYKITTVFSVLRNDN